MNFECQPSIIRGAKRSCTQMLFTSVVSDAPVPAVCQVLQPFQTELNKANGSKSVPKQVCDSSTCVSPGTRFSFSCPDKESDLWQNKKGSVSSLAGCSSPKNQTPTAPTCSPRVMLIVGLAGVGGFHPY